MENLATALNQLLAQRRQSQQQLETLDQAIALWIGSRATDPRGEGTIQSALSLQPPANESLKLRRLGGQE